MIGFVRGFGAASPRIGRVYKREIQDKGVVREIVSVPAKRPIKPVYIKHF